MPSGESPTPTPSDLFGGSNELKAFLRSKKVGPKNLFAWSEDFKSYLLAVDDQFDPGHRVDHVQRAVNNALQLASKEEGVNYEIMLPAIWMHDCVPISKHSDKRPMASQISADRAIEYLREARYPSQYFDAIKHAISAHSFSAGIKPETLEAAVVQDADRLDSLGAVGIARVFLLGGQFNNSIYHPEAPFCQERELEERSYIVDHFYTKLLKLSETFCTESGKQEAEKRTQYMQGYIQELADEIGVVLPIQSGVEPRAIGPKL